jgi:hypothetical protein
MQLLRRKEKRIQKNEEDIKVIINALQTFASNNDEKMDCSSLKNIGRK